MTSNYDTITTSQDEMTRVIFARTDAEQRRRKMTAELLHSVATQNYWRGRQHPDVLNELAEDLAKALLHIIKDADSKYNLRFLIEGIELGMFAPPERFDERDAMKLIEYRIERLDRGPGWVRIGDIHSFDFEPFGDPEGSNEKEFNGYYPDTVRAYNANRVALDANALKEFGKAIATLSWRSDPHNHGLGSPLMVATIAYLRVFGPARSEHASDYEV